VSTITLTTDGGAKTCALNDGETVLEALERQGVAVPNSCRAGVCQSCLMRATAGAPPAESQKGLKDALRAGGYFLACVCRPTADLTVQPAGDAARRARAVVRRVEKLSRDVARVVLACDGPFDYFPGQFVNLVRPADGLTRSYSLAGLRPERPEDPQDLMELHVRRVNGGAMSTWLHEQARPGDDVELRGPHGDCFYVPGRPGQPILLAGTGSGLAPLYAIARDALRQGHAGPIRLYHGALEAAGLYLVDELLDLSRRHDNFTYVRCLVSGEDAPGVRVGPLDMTVLNDAVPAGGKFAGWRVFLCGNPELVNGLRKKIFLAGASMKEIYSDAFVMRGPPAPAAGAPRA
jgi:NAD(P)H-flavin reductase/ferredoxin